MPGKNNCGPTIASSCVFTSMSTLSIMGDNKLPCDATIDDIIIEIDSVLKRLMDSNDFTHLDVPPCFSFDPITVIASTLHQIELTKICENSSDITDLQTQLSTLDIGSKNINITLPDCLQSDSAPCAVGVNQYTLISLITLFANMLCDHETRISNLE